MLYIHNILQRYAFYIKIRAIFIIILYFCRQITKKKLYEKHFLIITLVFVALFSGCDNNDNPAVDPPSKDYFPSWNTCEALTLLQEYVEDVTNPRSANFISAEDRIATFDMDGTFVGELYPTYFEYNLLEYPSMATAYRRSILSSRKIRSKLCLSHCAWYGVTGQKSSFG